ncbi:MAG: polysulfide reductase NrfD [Rhodococcus sp.]|nr:polysulfide reductase NrfD [Rhodococcus sp. (in: high G+C Gram-positive bacteria)]
MATADLALNGGPIPPPHQLDPEWINPALVQGETSYSAVTETVCRVNEVERTSKAWWAAFAISSAFAGLFVALILYLIFTGVGVWGNTSPIFWGFPIVNFVFWVGIGHAGTLISAILYLFRQNWRTSINRFAEAMTIFAVVCAGTFPGIHIGRVWFAYWLFPVPTSHLYMWPNFRSPLLWDVFAVSTYASVSVVFWYMGMIPDLATLRDRATSRVRQIAYAIGSLGWTGSASQWRVYETAYMLLAALAAPLVLSVHTIVSFDFAVSQLPGWHTTIFPPYFVAGAVFSGFAMVITLIVPCREWYGMKNLVTTQHLENICKILLATGTMVGLAYTTEFFIAWYSAAPVERTTFINRMFGLQYWAYWIMFTCNAFIPQIFWWKKARTTPWIMFIVSIFVNIGMWFERYVIVITSQERTHLPSSWQAFSPTWVDIGMLVGSFGLFFTLFLLFLRFLPIVAMAEIKAVMSHEEEHREFHPKIEN